MRNKVLIVSPHFAPAAAPDGQRARMMLPYLREMNWEPSVLCVSPRFVDCPIDSLLCETFPQDIGLYYTTAFPSHITRLLGFSTLGWRSWIFLRQFGNKLLRKKKFSLVYFSTTQFLVMSLALYWNRRFKIPYVIDIQDPWYREPLEKDEAESLPGGGLKYNLAQIFAGRNEPRVLPQAAGITVVSPFYKDLLLKRYPDYPERSISVIPFGSLEEDWQILEEHQVRQSVFAKQPERIDLVYIGRGGSDLVPALRVLLNALSEMREKEPALYAKVRVHLVGTSYAPRGSEKKSFGALLKEYRLENSLFEYARRIPFYQSLRCMKDASMTIILGSRDAAYSPSKLYPSLMAKKPLMVICPVGSVLEKYARGLGISNIFSFSEKSAPLSDDIIKAIRQAERAEAYDVSPAILDSVSARAMTTQLVRTFDRAIGVRE